MSRANCMAMVRRKSGGRRCLFSTKSCRGRSGRRRRRKAFTKDPKWTGVMVSSISRPPTRFAPRRRNIFLEKPICCWSPSAEEGLGQSLKWEVSRGGDLFPHIYGPLPLSAVSEVIPLPLVNGVHQFPEGLPNMSLINFGFMALRPLLHCMDAEAAHGLTIKALKTGFAGSAKISSPSKSCRLVLWAEFPKSLGPCRRL